MNWLRAFGKLGYGVLFVLVIPALLILWARGLEHVIPELPMAGTPSIGWILVVVGFGVMAAGWWTLMRYGEGLPMNIAPPVKLVTQGIYAVLPHPIYTGFALMTAGYFMATDARPGFWIVTPCVMFGCATLVRGYECHVMQKRFGTADWSIFLHFPVAEDAVPVLADRISAYVIVLLPWFAIYELAIAFGPMPGAIPGYFAFEYGLPVLEGTEAIYALTYVFVLAAPLCCCRKRDLRRFMQLGLLATAIGAFCFILLPLIAPPRPFVVSGMWGRLLMFERANDGPAGAFPSFHVLWAFLAAWLYAHSLKFKPLWYVLASLMALSCVTTGMHSILDILGALGVFALVLNGSRLWRGMLRTAERVANSWREWRCGQMRILLHAVYSWAAAFLGILITVHLAGAEQMKYLLLIGFSVVLGAGVWGQFLKGKSNLARPFGFFGGLFGGVIGVFAANALGGKGWLLAGALSVAIPFIQATGRLRCLVQGCCHGRTCEPHEGIVVTRERSRVVYLAQLGQRPIYPTPLYSILYNLILGPLLIRAWTLSAPLPFITGMYLILGSMGRFIEESYRGIPQTPRFGGLTIYQWLALLGIVTGIFLTTLPGPAYTNDIQFVPSALLYGFIFGLIAAFAMSVDFPESTRRFSRLAPP